ncbi:MAG: DUF4349 domain-containing protein, partial [Deltaproteobacteria bacterium]|nr:DUF4349 domain-containing protein [Deltaproteobacteria bacterium]
MPGRPLNMTDRTSMRQRTDSLAPTAGRRFGPATKLLALGLAALWLASCGGYGPQMVEEESYAARADYDNAPASGGYSEEAESRRETVAQAEAMPAPRMAGPPRPPAPAPPRKVSYDSSGGARDKSGPSQAYQQQQAQQQQAHSDPKGREVKGEKKVEQPLVVYFGYLRLRVRRQIEAFDEVTKLAQAAGGYVQTLSGRTVVVRVPATDFDAAMARFAAVGEILDRRVKAVDVSKQFTDVESRLQVASQARARLLQLLERVKTTEERLQILEEIKRLTEAIETAESTLAALRNLADYFTITIDVEPVVQDGAGEVHRSPFGWVRHLTAHLVTLTEGKKSIAMTMPQGFVLFAEDPVFRAQAADTSLLRVGRVANEPKGDANFWSLAVHHEMEGRDEELVEQKTVGGLQVRVYRNKDVRP